MAKPMKIVSTTICFLLAFGALNSFTRAQTKGTGIIHGRVLSTLSEPLEKAQVRVFSKGMFVGEAYADVKGEYELKGLPEGKLTITVWSLGFVTGKKEIKLKEGQKRELKFVLKAGRLDDTEE